MQTLEAFANIYCSQEFARGLDNQMICLSVINTPLAMTEIVGNTLTGIALHKETSLHLPSKALIRNLVASDFCVGFKELALVAQWISILQERWQICHYFFLAHNMIATISMPVSLWALTAISVDRLLALLLGLRYRQVVTLRRVYVVVTVFWVLVGVGSSIVLMLNPDVVKVVSSTSITVCLITSIFSYTTIFFKLRNQQILVHNYPPEQANQTISLNIFQYRKTVSTSLWLQLALVFCYLPYLLLAPFAHRQMEKTQSSAFYLPLYSATTLMFFNSSLNPILCCWKIKEVRRVVKETLCCR